MGRTRPLDRPGALGCSKSRHGIDHILRRRSWSDAKVDRPERVDHLHPCCRRLGHLQESPARECAQALVVRPSAKGRDRRHAMHSDAIAIFDALPGSAASAARSRSSMSLTRRASHEEFGTVGPRQSIPRRVLCPAGVWTPHGVRGVAWEQLPVRSQARSATRPTRHRPGPRRGWPGGGPSSAG